MRGATREARLSPTVGSNRVSILPGLLELSEPKYCGAISYLVPSTYGGVYERSGREKGHLASPGVIRDVWVFQGLMRTGDQRSPSEASG